MFKGDPHAASLIRAFLHGYCGVGADYCVAVSIAETIGCGARSDLLWGNANFEGISGALLWSVEMYVRGIE